MALNQNSVLLLVLGINVKRRCTDDRSVTLEQATLTPVRDRNPLHQQTAHRRLTDPFVGEVRTFGALTPADRRPIRALSTSWRCPISSAHASLALAFFYGLRKDLSPPASPPPSGSRSPRPGSGGCKRPPSAACTRRRQA